MNMIQKKEITEIKQGLSGMGKWEIKIDNLSSWFLSFFAYYGEKDMMIKLRHLLKI